MDYRLEWGLWVLLSIILYAGWGNFRRYVVEKGRGRAGLWLQRQLQNPFMQWAFELGAVLYYLGIPYVALIRGIAVPRFMGLSHLDWVKGTGYTAVLCLAFFLILALMQVYILRVCGYDPDTGASGMFTRLQEGLFLQAHWAFYRAFATAFLGVYWGVLMGLALAGVEWGLSPEGREVFGVPKVAFKLMRIGGLAIATSVVFLFSQNLLLALVAHWLLAEGLARVGR
ncbi:MAG TPA: hypothetical protein ENG33_07735 [Chloroflexi bacterium]|nr:hypothetical protein [Chloroflexota bacterium]